ncbi:MAG: hypothetical protein JWQ02_3365 [Capsulimonas sp.]|nr:hypothetical protein [Capsulimonas sp.]
MTNTITAPAYPSLLQTITALAQRDIEIGVVDNDLAVAGKTDKLTTKLREALDHHKPEILRIADLRTKFTRIDGKITALRYQEYVYGASRQESLDYVWRMIKSFAKRCDMPTGYRDPSDPFSENAVLSLWADFEELTAEGNPYPIPRTDPRMRYLNGVLAQ